MTYLLVRASDEKLESLLSTPQGVAEFIQNASPSETVDLDKSWHLLHYALTGSPDPVDGVESFIVGQWPEIGDVAVGWGPAWAMSSQDVAVFAAFLASRSDEEIGSAFKIDEMIGKDVYIANAFDGDDEGAIEFTMQTMTDFRSFLAKCVETDTGAVGCLV